MAVEARAVMEGEGVPTRVVSLPSWRLFMDQDAAYRESVLPAAVSARVSVEAGTTMGWDRWTGEAGAIIGLDHFGASAPWATLYEQFGITSEKVVEAARGVLGS